MKLTRRKKDIAPNNAEDIILEIKKINSELEKAYDIFQNQTDDDLLEASIYNILSLKSRHSYLIKLAKENKAEAVYMNFSEKEKIKHA